MIRFVDVRNQDIDYRFAFWDTRIEKFISINGEMAWDDWSDFFEVASEHQQIARFKRLCPEWVFQNNIIDKSELNIDETTIWGMPREPSVHKNEKRSFFKNEKE